MNTKRISHSPLIVILFLQFFIPLENTNIGVQAQDSSTYLTKNAPNWIKDGFTVAGKEVRQQVLEYAPAPVDNPLKGLVPYVRDGRGKFPHSMEFNYIPLSALVTGYDQYDWKPLENLLDSITSRGHQTVFRVYLEFPGWKDAIPKFLIREGLKVHKWGQGKKPASETPDYSDTNLQKVLKHFIAELGKKYDGDPRIGFISAGLLGSWGEWHNWPRNDLFASKEVQVEVMDAYEAAFKTTPVLLRYPQGEWGEWRERWAPNSSRRFGYEDDSFAWGTLETGRKEDGWFFMAMLKGAGSEALGKWKTQPIGGEIRPEAWGEVFDPDHDLKQIQDFRKCVEYTHVSWLMDSGMFGSEKEQNSERIKRAEEEVRRMGYEFHVSSVTISAVTNGRFEVNVEVENRGVAPFYYDWPIEFGLLSTDDIVAKTFNSTSKLIGLLPGDKPRVWNEMLNLQGLKAGAYMLALRVPNPLPKGMPVRFANDTQDQHAFGWLTLMPITDN
ncbi:MAG: DUF4832 domain-containing protein [Prolixibacteraceae bacterium]|jgi:hypothetical protein|nr:DUF4832 domain-containing protein [Prolixibacteraceae bacterium]